VPSLPPSLLLDARNSEGGTPLHGACWGGKIEVIKVLIKKGADIHALTHDGRTALHLLVQGREGEREEVVGEALRAVEEREGEEGGKAWVDVRERQGGKTALMMAAERGCDRMIGDLSSLGRAAWRKRDYLGRTAWHWAKEGNNTFFILQEHYKEEARKVRVMAELKERFRSTRRWRRWVRGEGEEGVCVLESSREEEGRKEVVLKKLQEGLTKMRIPEEEEEEEDGKLGRERGMGREGIGSAIYVGKHRNFVH